MAQQQDEQMQNEQPQGNKRALIIILPALIAGLATVLAAVIGEEDAAPQENDRTYAVAERGMVSSATSYATEAGLEILEAGGNAFDAFVATAAALNVTEPAMSGVGGYGTIVLWDAGEGRAHFLNSSGLIPRRVDSDAYRAPTPGYMENRRGAKAVSTPGNAAAWESMWERFGSMEWADLFEPAIRLAEEGVVLDGRFASLIGWAFDSFPDHARAIYGRDGVPLQQGERFIQADLGRSLRMIAEQGAQALHGGELGEAVDRAMREAGGFLRLDDLAENEAEWYDPISIDYRGYEVVTAPPPANSFPALVRLGMMSLYDNRASGHNSAEFLHRFCEVTKHGFWTRLRFASDPLVAPVPLGMLLSEEYWQEQVGTIEPDRARPFEYPDVIPPEGMNTTHFVVADRFGNIVSATQTLGNGFGSRIMPEGTGFWLNNSLAYCTFEPKGNPMDAFPGRHKLSGDVPILIIREGRPWVALGTPGGHTIGQTVPQMVMNLIDFDMDVLAAIAAPRISFVEPDVIVLEDGIDGAVVRTLRSYGHNIRTGGGLGLAHGLAIEYNRRGRPVRFMGAADWRGAGLAKGY
ncbi:gamma-glutamyltransferase family protein [Gemmatimonadota bacterium]